MKWLIYVIIVFVVVVTSFVSGTGTAQAMSDSSTPARMTASGFWYTVRYGDTLYAIALRFGVSVWTLARVNHIWNINRIYAGQRLFIPTAPTPPAPGVYYVRPGDTLYKIAHRFGVSMWALARINRIYNLNRIYVGQRLFIPGPGYPPPPPRPRAWRGEYWNNMTLSGAPDLVRSDVSINFDWGWGGPAPGINRDYFSARWVRTLYFAGGTYRFYARSDDGVRVWVDSQLLIDEWRRQAATSFAADIILAPGPHTVRVEYFEQDGLALIQVWSERR
ncbi:MAG TPA: LysM peptidoglycan-binding domain-containing protein [Anaerolineae bacterium]|nr:LysM peptidoglycan-binding domain-containing protein [Anaerolineae bacterium]HIQ04082.1 LysM peptidoglycan-binding domain-containing protein [Anaerolineae bacterium]